MKNKIYFDLGSANNTSPVGASISEIDGIVWSVQVVDNPLVETSMESVCGGIAVETIRHSVGNLQVRLEGSFIVLGTAMVEGRVGRGTSNDDFYTNTVH